MARIALATDPVGLRAKPVPCLSVSATVQIREYPSSIKNKDLQTPNQANTKSNRDSGDATKPSKKSVSIRVHPCPIQTINPIAPHEVA